MGELVPVLQLAIGPVILISGVGLLLLTMTNRFGRIIDRSRQLARELKTPDAPGRTVALTQVAILARRARLVRRAILLASLSVLLAALLIIALFFTALWRLEAAALVAALFIACLVSLIASLVDFIRDVNQSLIALKLELRAAAGDGARP